MSDRRPVHHRRGPRAARWNECEDEVPVIEETTPELPAYYSRANRPPAGAVGGHYETAAPNRATEVPQTTESWMHVGDKDRPQDRPNDLYFNSYRNVTTVSNQYAKHICYAHSAVSAYVNQYHRMHGHTSHGRLNTDDMFQKINPEDGGHSKDFIKKVLEPAYQCGIRAEVKKNAAPPTFEDLMGHTVILEFYTTLAGFEKVQKGDFMEPPHDFSAHPWIPESGDETDNEWYQGKQPGHSVLVEGIDVYSGLYRCKNSYGKDDWNGRFWFRPAAAHYCEWIHVKSRDEDTLEGIYGRKYQPFDKLHFHRDFSGGSFSELTNTRRWEYVTKNVALYSDRYFCLRLAEPYCKGDYTYIGMEIEKYGEQLDYLVEAIQDGDSEQEIENRKDYLFMSPEKQVFLDNRPQMTQQDDGVDDQKVLEIPPVGAADEPANTRDRPNTGMPFYADPIGPAGSDSEAEAGGKQWNDKDMVERAHQVVAVGREEKIRHLVVFLHGYNNSEGDVEKRNDLIDDIFGTNDVVTHPWNWISAEKVTGYSIDKKMIRALRKRLKEFVRQVVLLDWYEKIDFVAHSMGNALLVETMDSDERFATRFFRNSFIVCIASDAPYNLNKEVVTYMTRQNGPVRGWAHYYNPWDYALTSSEWLPWVNSWENRAGNRRVELDVDEPDIVRKVQNIRVDGDWKSFAAHGYIADEHTLRDASKAVQGVSLQERIKTEPFLTRNGDDVVLSSQPWSVWGWVQSWFS